MSLTLKPAHLFLLLLFVFPVVAAEKQPRTISNVITDAPVGWRVLVKGDVSRIVNFDYFILKDESGEILVYGKDIPHEFRPGEKVYIMGQYREDDAVYGHEELIDAFGWCDIKDREKAAKLIKKYGVPPSKTTKKSKKKKSSSLTGPVETRLKKLEKLKRKKLITEEEYKTHRKRILNDL